MPAPFSAHSVFIAAFLNIAYSMVHAISVTPGRRPRCWDIVVFAPAGKYLRPLTGLSGVCPCLSRTSSVASCRAARDFEVSEHDENVGELELGSTSCW